MERYFLLYPDNEGKAILHYQCNLELSEAMYVSLSVLEVTLRNAICKELRNKFGREDWYASFPQTPGLPGINKYITEATRHIAHRKEPITPSKIIAELTLGFWVSLFNCEYEQVLWKELRRAFPNMPKIRRQRKNISAPLNRFRSLRNRVFHNESICWNLDRISNLHGEIVEVLGWINKDAPEWLAITDRFNIVINKIKKDLQNT